MTCDGLDDVELSEEELGSRVRLMCGLCMMQCENWAVLCNCVKRLGFVSGCLE